MISDTQRSVAKTKLSVTLVKNFQFFLNNMGNKENICDSGLIMNRISMLLLTLWLEVNVFRGYWGPSQQHYYRVSSRSGHRVLTLWIRIYYDEISKHRAPGLRRVNNGGQCADGAIWRVERLSMSNESDYWHQIWSGWLWHRKYVSGIMVCTPRWHPDPCPHLHLAQSEFMFEILNSQFVEARKLKQWSFKIGFKSAC